jgi:hypothetical protein
VRSLNAPCALPEGYAETPAPIIAAGGLVAHAEEITIGRSLDAALARAEATSLEDAVSETGALPHVTGTLALTRGAFGAPGTKRLVCLSDGSVLQEQVVSLDRDARARRFRYVVWGYTAATARPIAYGVGEFIHTELENGRTHVRWTYAFALRRDHFPGALGPVGDWMFRTFFLERDYAAMMRATLAKEAQAD